MRVIKNRLVPATVAGSANFTGRVWRSDFLEAADDHSLAGLRLSYDPGARSFWHVHDQEQVIVGVFGAGLVSWEGLDAPQLLETGDWWHVTPGVPHWHGATPHGPFAHLAVTAGGATHWLHEVSEPDYAAGFRDR
ncbi:MAG: cupin domain-containing protein [Jatrophihabitans sp.]|uniref:cupin domain-containing protein n=1 Tax=Jatrophihabitans sp. TaxID=1932789 RepID=UPI003912E928